MAKGTAAICWCTQQRNVIATLLLLYTNMAAMTSHANQEYIRLKESLKMYTSSCCFTMNELQVRLVSIIYKSCYDKCISPYALMFCFALATIYVK